LIGNEKALKKLLKELAIGEFGGNSEGELNWNS